MRLFTSLGTALVAFAASALAIPLSEVQMGSKHTLFLATCTTRSLLPGCPLIIICPRASDPDSSDPSTAAQTYNAVAYYATSTTSDSPTEMVTVRERGSPWEGTRSSARMLNGRFYSDIDANAKNLPKSSIAGTAKVGSEDFVCFRDGETDFDVTSNGIIGGSTSHCVADYWCASVSV